MTNERRYLPINDRTNPMQPVQQVQPAMQTQKMQQYPAVDVYLHYPPQSSQPVVAQKQRGIGYWFVWGSIMGLFVLGVLTAIILLFLLLIVFL